MTPYTGVMVIDESNRPDHHYLDAGDQCFYMGEYIARGGFGLGGTNNLISNFKKSPEHRGTSQWRYKTKASDVVAKSLENCVNEFERYLFVPIPSSKARDDPLHDSRLIDVFERCASRVEGFAYADVLHRPISVEATHVSNAPRPRPAELARTFELKRKRLTKAIGDREVVVFDDVITTGSHFKAAQLLLAEVIPEERISGLFVARRVPEPFDPSVFDDLDDE